MRCSTISTLLDLNHLFYQRFGQSFAETRRRIQPGVRRVLDGLPDEGAWLELGCGSGRLAVEWASASGKSGCYLGLDFSETFLDEARRSVAGLAKEGQKEHLHLRQEICFQQADLSDPGWASGLEPGSFDGGLAFAVLHHLPGVELRRQVLSQLRALLKPQGFFIHSEWQFQHSPKLMARRLPWEMAGLSEGEVDEGDTLLDWRAENKVADGGSNLNGLRYVHLFSREELADLARECGFEIVEEFESDGQGGRLGLYQKWKVG